jgi:tRNA(Ile)-lysidine synthase
MIHFLNKIPHDPIYVAVSGGLDSMVILDFLLMGKHKPIIIHYDHGTSHGKDARQFVQDFCADKNLECIIGSISDNGAEKDKQESWEEYWGKHRNLFFHSFPGVVITAHNLDDAVEWWLFSSLHGEGKLIPYKNENVIRPFLITSKTELRAWAQNKNVSNIEDPSNSDVAHSRNRIRHELLPIGLKVNPGLYKVIKKKYLGLEE